MAQQHLRSLTRRSLAQLMRLSGRKALVTGGAGRIGRVVVETLQELGARMAVLDLPEALAHVRDRRVARLACNLADEDQTRQAIREVTRRLGGLDILVHCAAYTGMSRLPGWAVPFERQTVQAWDSAMRVNLTSAFIMVQEARRALAASGHGSVIFLASIYGLVGPDHRLYAGTTMGHPAAYGAAKSGLVQLARSLATTLAPRVRINVISPGGIWDGQPERFHRRYVARTPLKRMATTEDLKGALAYLASDLSSYVTGQNVIVDGGWTIW